ncbi:MAG: type II toxin-antitoxin system RatA family toxin [Beijerinckiaceae bacterium]
MTSFRTTRRVRHTAEEMFDLVADVEAYPNFVPLCCALRVRRRSVTGDGKQVLIADMEVGYKAIRESFTSRVALDRANLEIFVNYVDGPFKQMENRWHFVPVGENACCVEFDISYEFKSRTLALVLGGMFDAAFRKFSEAFEMRANRVYGTV